MMKADAMSTIEMLSILSSCLCENIYLDSNQLGYAVNITAPGGHRCCLVEESSSARELRNSTKHRTLLMRDALVE